MKLAVIGGGLTGCIAALEAADRGCNVTLYEREADLLGRASTANEGKIHLGYVYGADPSLDTAAGLIEDALLFRPILERWMTSAAFQASLYAPFQYIVPPTSTLPVDTVCAHFKRVEAHLAARSNALGLSYLGQPETPPFAITTRCDQTSSTWISTREAGVHPGAIARAMRESVSSHPRIETLLCAAVDHVSHSDARWRIHLSDNAATQDAHHDHVINATWADRRRIDAASGFSQRETWFTRYKFGVLLHNASAHFGGDLPQNATGTSGLFGDSVYFPQTDSLYCSWYPVGMCYASTAPTDARTPPQFLDIPQLIRDTWTGYATLDPHFARLATQPATPDAELIGDYIIARGASDIDDPNSQLHRRTRLGAQRLADGYWSVETGKYTSAPRCGTEVIDAILGPR